MPCLSCGSERGNILNGFQCPECERNKILRAQTRAVQIANGQTPIEEASDNPFLTMIGVGIAVFLILLFSSSSNRDVGGIAATEPIASASGVPKVEAGEELSKEESGTLASEVVEKLPSANLETVTATTIQTIPAAEDTASSEPIRVKVLSFNCNKASVLAEALVCTNRDLVARDFELVSLYESKLRNQSDNRLMLSQNEWLSTLRKCLDKQCLIEAYTARAQAVEDWE